MKTMLTSTKFPFWFLHLPIVPYILYLGYKAGSFTFFTAINPKIHAGGFLNSEKYNLLTELPTEKVPKSILIKNFSTTSFEDIKSVIIQNNISPPWVLKPNKGERGLGVKVIKDLSQLERVHYNYHFDAIIQEFIENKSEFGILIHWDYNSSKPKITSLTYKSLPFVIGDGETNLKKLIKEKFGSKYLDTLNYQASHILQQDKKIFLNHIAHRSTGTEFICYNSFIDERLTSKVWSVLENIKDFQYGRIDVMASSLNELLEFENVKILEVNGVNSVPIHAFDMKYNLFEMYTIMAEHWKILYHIYFYNEKLGISPLSLKSFFKEVLNKKYNA